MDHKSEIINSLEKMRMKELADKQTFKARAYMNVIKQIKSLSHVKTYDDLKGIDGIGPSIKNKIEEILNTGKLHQVEEYESKMKDKIDATEALLKIHGIGPAKAKQLIDEHGIKSIDDLKLRQDLLNDKQKMGLKYWEDFDLRIPRAEMEKHEEYLLKIIKSVDKKYVAEITGSFRRGEKTSGDIDILITHPDDTLDHEANFKKIIDKFIEEKYVCDIFAQGAKKCLAVCKAKRHKHFRRIDFMLTHKHEFPFALLYFTGSGDFNVNMRNYALSKGYSLSEYGLKCTRGPRDGEFVNHGFEKEEDIFEFLGLKYVKPSERKANVLASYIL